MWNLFHKSNEISVEIQGLDPHPKSIRHVDAKNISAAEKNFVEVLQIYESGQSSVAIAKLIILSFSFIQFYITFLWFTLLFGSVYSLVFTTFGAESERKCQKAENNSKSD